MFKLGLKNLKNQLVLYLIIVSFIAVSVGTALTAVMLNQTVSEGYAKMTENYDVIVGPVEGDSELFFSNLLFAETPSKTIAYEAYEDLDVENKIPIAIGDAYKQDALIVGTLSKFLFNYEIAKGKSFEDKEDLFEIVIGAGVAVKYNLSIGSKIVASHDATHEHVENPYTVVGILEPTMSNIDYACYTFLNNIWELHEAEEAESGDTEEADGHVHAGEGSLTGILVKTTSLGEYTKVSAMDGDIVSVVTVNEVARKLMSTSNSLIKLIEYLAIMLLLVTAIAIVYVLGTLWKSFKRDLRVLKNVGASEFDRMAYVYTQVAVVVVQAVTLACVVGILEFSMMQDILAANGIIL